MICEDGYPEEILGAWIADQAEANLRRFRVAQQTIPSQKRQAADLEDNMDIRRMAGVTEKRHAKVIRLSQGLAVLQKEIHE